MKWLKWIGIVVVVLVVLFVGVGALLPSEFSVERSVVISAGPEQIHELVGDLRQWPEWAPWSEMDPSIQTTYGETTTGVGASQSWTSNSGDGELTFTMSDVQTGVVYDMSFDEGAFLCKGSLRYETAPDGTKVTWDFKGDSGWNLIGRYMGLMMDTMVGEAFTKGLDSLKAKAEAAPPAPE